MILDFNYPIRKMNLGRGLVGFPKKASSLFLIFIAAINAAIPLRSEPLEAAVGEVLGTLSVLVAVTCILSSAIPR